MRHPNQVKHSHVGEAVSEEEKIDNTRDDRKPGASGLPGDESFPKVEGAPNPEKLAGNEHHEDAEEKQVSEAPVLVGVYDQEGRIGKNRQENDGAFISYEKTDHPCHLRAGKMRRRNYKEHNRHF
jgi:hypothetical protein